MAGCLMGVISGAVGVLVFGCADIPDWVRGFGVPFVLGTWGQAGDSGAVLPGGGGYPGAGRALSRVTAARMMRVQGQVRSSLKICCLPVVTYRAATLNR